jgi:ATP-binding cassette subfamily B protein
VRLVRRHLLRHRRAFALGFLCLLATNGLTLIIPWTLKVAIERLGRGAPWGTIALLAAAMAGAAVVIALARTRSRLYILGASRRVVFDVRNEIFNHLTTLPASFYGRMRTGEIMSRTVNDLLLVRSLFGPGLLNLANVFFLYTAGLALMVLLDPGLTLAAVLPYPLLLIGVARASRTIHGRSNAAQEALADISHKAQENLSGIVMVKAYAREESEIGQFGRLAREYRRRSLALARSRGWIVSLMVALGHVSTLAVFWIGGRHVLDGRLSVGGLIAFLAYLALLTGPTIMMGWVVGVFQRGAGAIRRIEEILDTASDLPGDRIEGAGAPFRGAVSMRGLRFGFPGARVEHPAIDGVELEVEAGATIGIVGRIGSGKSALVGALAGIHRVPDGALSFEGVDLNAIPTRHLRSQVVLVPQEGFLFSRSIAENIALGAPEADRSRIEAAAGLAGLDADLRDFPQGLDTLVGERGVTLSGGQRQRVALARALIVDPPILVLDDALASVDAATAEGILERLRAARRGRTTFIVAHRLATVLHADRVVVLDHGRIVEAGAPRDLLAAAGPFARLHRQQQIEQELEAL